jgi:hypothetical protein
MITPMGDDPRRKVGAAFDPRARLYRDRFNEYLVFILSAAGAAVGVPLILLVAGAVIGEFGLLPFLVASVLLEWFFIFAVGRPQMKRHEALGWALLWGTAAAIFGLCFYYLVFTGLL